MRSELDHCKSSVSLQYSSNNDYASGLFRQVMRQRRLEALLQVIAKLKETSRNVSGASMVEFAICCPLYMMLLAGILSYGLYFGACHSVSQLAADAARASVAGLSAAERQSIVEARVTQNIGAYPLLSLSRTSVATSAGASPGSYQVSITYDASNLPLWFVFIPSPQPTI